MRHRPHRHIRMVRTKRGKKKVVVNPTIVLHQGKHKKVIKKGHKNYEGLIQSVEDLFDYTAKGVGELPQAIHIVGHEGASGLRHLKHGQLGQGVKHLGKGGVGAVKDLGKGGITIIRGPIEAVKDLPKKPYI